MDIGSIFLILALLIPIILFIIRPIIERSLVQAHQPEQDLSTLMAERDHVVASIQELDDDYHLGKLPVEEYPPQRLALLQSGADILRKIDSLQERPASMPAAERLETAIKANRLTFETGRSPSKKNGNAVPPVPDDELEQKIASRRRSMQGKVGGFCPKCGRPVQVNDRFCPHCGSTLS